MLEIKEYFLFAQGFEPGTWPLSRYGMTADLISQRCPKSPTVNRYLIMWYVRVSAHGLSPPEAMLAGADHFEAFFVVFFMSTFALIFSRSHPFIFSPVLYCSVLLLPAFAVVSQSSPFASSIILFFSTPTFFTSEPSPFSLPRIRPACAY